MPRPQQAQPQAQAPAQLQAPVPDRVQAQVPVQVLVNNDGYTVKIYTAQHRRINGGFSLSKIYASWSCAMTNEYINFIVFLENTLATYYQKIKNLARLEPARSVLEFMEVHSFEHAKIIEEARGKYPKPMVRESLITDFQNNLLNTVFKKISDEKDILRILEILAESEESVGKLYQSFSSLLKKLSDHYLSVAEEIENIAKQEFDHRDLLLKDRARLASKIR